MVTISWEVMIGIVGFFAVVGPGMYWLGKVSQKVEENASDIRTIFTKIDEIYKFIKNGRKEP